MKLKVKIYQAHVFSSNNMRSLTAYLSKVKCVYFQLTTLRGSILEDAVPSSGRLSSSRGVPVKDVLEMGLGDVQVSCLKQATPGPKTAEQLLKLDEQGVSLKSDTCYCTRTLREKVIRSTSSFSSK